MRASQRRLIFTTVCALAAVLLVATPSFAAHVGIYTAGFQLDPSQEVPAPVNPGNSLGSCVAILDDANAMLDISCTHNVSNAVAAHIHFEDRGVAGPIEFPFPSPGSPLQLETALTPEQEATLLVGNAYVNVHTPENPAGEIRGQIDFRPQEDTSSLFFGTDDDSTFSADCRAILSERTGESDLRVICVHDVSDAQLADLRFAAGGGGALLFDDASSPLDQTFTLTQELVEAYLNNELILQISSDTGATRAALRGCRSDSNTLCLNDNRFAVNVTGSAPSGDGFDPFTGTAFARTDTSGEFSFFTADNLEILIKVINGCPVNNHFWVFFSALTNVEFTVEVTDTETGITNIYENAQGEVADPITDNSAFMTCP